MRKTIWLAAMLVSSALWAQPHPLLSSGPMLGYSEMTEVQLWVQTTKPAKVQFRYRPLAGGEWKMTPVFQTTEAGDLIAKPIVGGLPFGTKFEYELWINGKKVERNYRTEFQTQPHWRWAKNPPEPPQFTIAVGSCSYFNDPPFDRPGKPYGGDYEIYKPLTAAKPDLMLWIGDALYYREMDWLTPTAMRARWRKDRAFPELQPFLASTHHYATWDDHDYGPNDSDRSFRLRDAALNIFDDYFPAIVRGTRETPGCFFRFEWGDVEFFMLDDRFHRSPNNTPEGPDKVMFGKPQIQWLKDSLLNSSATFKIIVGGNQMLNPVAFYESFSNYKTEQKDLLDFIAQRRIPGIVFLSGDRHWTELIKVQWPGAGYAFYDYTTSPLGSGASGGNREDDNPARVPGTHVKGQRNYALIKVEGKWGERVLVLGAYDKDGKTLWTHRIPHADLKPK